MAAQAGFSFKIAERCKLAEAQEEDIRRAEREERLEKRELAAFQARRSAHCEPGNRAAHKQAGGLPPVDEPYFGEVTYKTAYCAR